jgi:hypothetical protein
VGAPEHVLIIVRSAGLGQLGGSSKPRATMEVLPSPPRRRSLPAATNSQPGPLVQRRGPPGNGELEASHYRRWLAQTVTVSNLCRSGPGRPTRQGQNCHTTWLTARLREPTPSLAARDCRVARLAQSSGLARQLLMEPT